MNAIQDDNVTGDMSGDKSADFKDTKSPDPIKMAVYVSIPSLTAIVLVVAGIGWRMRRRKPMRTENPGGDVLQLSPILMTMLDEDTKIKLQMMLLPRDALHIEQLLGQGAFGHVYRGSYNAGQDDVRMVAVKSLKASCIGSDIAGFVSEAVTMSEFSHMHILSIIGVCIRAEDGVPILVLPYMDNGDLKAYLTQFNFSKSVSEVPDEKQLLLFCLHIARGMEYLAEQKFIHRDLAARNCMLDSTLVVKIADFGLSRDIYTSMYYRQDQQKLLPIKWMALEILQFQTFTFETDVWSFGVTMWEILSLGMGPYPELDNAGVMKHLKCGHRLEKPDACSDDMFKLMSSCWRENPELRPTFTDISNKLGDYLANMFNYFELNSSVDESETLPNRNIEFS